MRVLIVDDEPDIRRIAQLALEGGGFITAAAASGPECMGMIEGFDPDVVLMDVMMPGLDGLQLLARLREGGASSTPVIFMTAKVQPGEVQEYLAAGVRAVICKPFDPLALPGRIETILQSGH